MAPSTFHFVRIPHDDSQPVEELTGDTSGGLENDYLVAHAKKFFTAKGAKPQGLSSEQVDGLPAEQKRQLADQIREQARNSSPGYSDQLDKLDDEMLLSLYKSSASASAQSCDIIALTVPTPANDHRAVSMYVPIAPSPGSSSNSRAVALLTACGHAARDVAGDVFVGRARDDEAADVWTRVDFVAEDADPLSEWCAVARSKQGGGGNGGKSAHSLQGTVSNMFAGKPAPSVVGDGNGNDATEFPQMEHLPANDNHEHTTDGYVWSQNEDEVEIKVTVPAGTKSKSVKVVFQRSSIKVSINGELAIQGELGGTIIVEDSTYTLQDVGGSDDRRELCVTLGKEQSGRVWTAAVRKE